MASSFSLAEARRIAIAAQGLDLQRPARPDIRHIRKIFGRLGLIQIDYVNVLVPAHYQVLFSRLGPYRRALLDELLFQRHELIEQWAHEASIVPMEFWPLLQHRRESFRQRPYGFESFFAENTAYVEGVIARIRQHGPVTADQLEPPAGRPKGLEHTWYGTMARIVLEAHFARGRLAISNRLPNFARAYDLAERIVPGNYLGAILPAAEQSRELVRRAARACGIGRVADFADYYRMKVSEAAPRVAELVEAGELRPAEVEGAIREKWFIHMDARSPQRVTTDRLLSPFDPLIWYRPRVARLFGFDYRVEIFVPQPQRKWGYYVLPFLMGDRLAARVDLKADRRAGRLHVLSCHVEDHAMPGDLFDSLRTELQRMAAWLGLADVKFDPPQGKMGGRRAASPNIQKRAKVRKEQ